MSIALPALAVAFAAFCVWLTVRLVNRRERWAKWTAIALVAYPLTFGPACWLTSHLKFGRDAVALFYLPLFVCWANGPQPLANGLDWWMHCGAAEREQAVGEPDCILIRLE